MPAFDLREQAVQFGDSLSSLLNGTICTGIRVATVIRQSGTAVLGYKIGKENQDATEGIPVTLGKRPPWCYLGLSFRLEPDEANQYLQVTSSFMGVFADSELDRVLFHYDYERDKGDGYPEAHLQVCAQSTAWDAVCASAGLEDRPLQKLHLPVGGRRYRPTLEDLVEFLITEDLADSHAGWTQHVEAGREDFQRRQLRAAVRRDPASAIALLRKEGHIPEEPGP